MIDFTFVTFAFLAGIVAFFSPCSVVLLPGYIAYYLGKGDHVRLRFFQKLVKGIIFGFITVLGFFTVFGIAGLLVVILGQVVKKFIPWLSVVFGLGLIILGIFMLLGKHFSLNLNFLKLKAESGGLYLFGVTYAVAALGCVFPIFLTIMLQALVGNNFFDAVVPLLAYIAGISIIMFVVTQLIIFSRVWMSRNISRMLPYVNYVGAIILILAGAYMIYYQFI